VRFIQFLQTQVQKRLIAAALNSPQGLLEVPWYVRWLVGVPGLRKVLPRLIAYGLVRVHVEN